MYLNRKKTKSSVQITIEANTHEKMKLKNVLSINDQLPRRSDRLKSKKVKQLF